MLTILATLIALSVLILVHEFGHFFAAKWMDIAAPRFSLGLGPRVAGFKWGETDFVISAIPLGGYVKMAGMEDDEASAALEGGEDLRGEVWDMIEQAVRHTVDEYAPEGTRAEAWELSALRQRLVITGFSYDAGMREQQARRLREPYRLVPAGLAKRRNA